MVIFLQFRKGFKNTKKTKGLSKEEIKKKLIDYIVVNDKIETDELNEKAGKIEKLEEAAAIIKEENYYIHRVSSRKRKSSSN